MGFIQKDAARTMVISYLGLVLGYVNKGILFIWFLSTEQIGLVNLLVTVGLLFGNLSGLGSHYAIWKFFPFLRNKDRRHYGFLPLILIVSTVGCLLFSLVAVLFQSQIALLYGSKSTEFVHYYYWIVPLGIANAFYVVFDYFLRSMYYNIVSIIVYELVLRLLILLLLIFYGLDLFSFDTFLVIHCLLYFMPVVFLGWYLFRLQELNLSLGSISIPKRFRKIILSFSLLSYLNSVGALIVVTVDAMMIAGMLGLKATGVYTMVIFLASALQIPYRSLHRIATPLVADYWKEKNMPEMEKLYKKFSSVNLVISLTVFMVVWICRNEIFHFLKPEYLPGIEVYLFLMIGRITDMYFGLNGTIFVTSKKYRYDIIFTVVLIAIVTVMSYVLIPIYGIPGAAMATCAAYLIYNFGRLLFVYFAYNIHPFEKSQLYVLLLFGGVLAFFELVPISVVNDYITITVKWLLFGLLFLLPIYAFKMETEIVRYIDNGLIFVRSKLRK